MTSRGLETLVLFDWNNTLVDDTHAMHVAASKIFQTCAKEPPPLEDYLRELAEGNGSSMPIYRKRGVDLSREEMQEIFQAEYLLQIGGINASSGAVAVLCDIAAQKIPMGIITSQYFNLFKPLMDKLCLWHLFKGRIFTDAMDKYGCMRNIIRAEDMSPDRCIYVGDMPHDISQANRAGATSVAYINGFVPKELLLATEPHYQIFHFSELPTVIEAHVRANQ